MSQASDPQPHMFDRAGTNPTCPECGYIMVALDPTRVACDHCGQIVVVPRRAEHRAVKLLTEAFGNVRWSDAGR